MTTVSNNAITFPQDLTVYADRHIHRMEAAAQDFDCMEREFDVSDPGFDPSTAAEVFSKCRLLVLRNVFPKKMMQDYRKKYDDYMYAIHTGKIDRFNTLTTDSRARDIVQNRGRKRHDVIVPKWLAGEQFTSNENILEILRNEKVLGRDMFPNHIGSVISEPGAPSMHWHYDTEYIWSQESFETSRIGGHDLPPFALSMFVPLFANGTYDHGPTEFCMGSSHLDGISMDPLVLDPTLIEEGSSFQKMQEFRETWDACPAEHWRVPLADMGDAIIFDYQILHRGGANRSPESRAMLFAMYSRFWFRDGNFDNTYAKEEESESDESNTGMRFALVEEAEVEHVDEASSTIRFLENFAGRMLDDADESSPPDSVDFFFTNHNVEGALISFDEGLQEEISPKEQWFLRGEVGKRLWVHNKEDGSVIDSWIVTPDQSETILVDRAT